MKSSLSILLFCFFSLSFAQVRWMTIDQAITAQKANPKKIIVDFYADWNTACKEMDNETFVHPEILKYLNDKFYIVKFNSEGDETVNIYDRVFKNPEFQVKSKLEKVNATTPLCSSSAKNWVTALSTSISLSTPWKTLTRRRTLTLARFVFWQQLLVAG